MVLQALRIWWSHAVIVTITMAKTTTTTTCSKQLATRPVWIIKATTPTTLVATTLSTKATPIAASLHHKASMAALARLALTKAFISTGHSMVKPHTTVQELAKPSYYNTQPSKRWASCLVSWLPGSSCCLRSEFPSFVFTALKKENELTQFEIY